jgi:8-oxo-dGTP diphosphatase
MRMVMSSIAIARAAAVRWRDALSSRPNRSGSSAPRAHLFFTRTIFTLDNGIVLLKRAVEPALGKWVFPGGYVDRGESVQEAAIRETLEESRLEVALISLLNVYSYSRSPNVIVVYTAEIVGGQLAVGDESLEAAIFAPEAIPWPELAFDSTRDALKDYIRLYPKHTVR